MYVDESGTPGRPGLLFVHGGGVAGWMWEHQRAHFSADHHVLVPDLPGHGRSAEQAYTSNRAAAEALAELIAQRTDGGRASVVGFSIGAQVTIELVSRFPHLVNSAVIVSALARPVRVGPLLPGLMAVTAPLARNRLFARAQARALRLPDERFEDYFRDSRAMSRPTLAAIGRENFSFRIPEEWDVQHVPSLIMAGDREPKALLDSVRELHRRAADSELYVAPGLGHGIPLQTPDDFNARVRTWLDRGRRVA
ncbi:alpha/beta fold hydrolase [Nocardiopsis ansamitocini]|uniref:alpha/beta fold hydrolase n=1 Tax=Nocardiopsis ansamitocini TaxID=1670832 RepID=UPI002555DCFE|nr:alpha/beta hydrolase [Nocardiopsis ansamitocini]